ncbi:DUF2017 family protein [Frigoribacterium salinisoli]
MPVRREGGIDPGGVRLTLAEHERGLLVDLAGQLGGLLEGGDRRDGAVARLLPSAYPDDAEADAEFRRWTSDDVTARKLEGARTVARLFAADQGEGVLLDDERQQALLRTLTDLRLVLGQRLGVTADGYDETDDEHELVLRDVFDWLGWVQESLLQAITEATPDGD